MDARDQEIATLRAELEAAQRVSEPLEKAIHAWAKTHHTDVEEADALRAQLAEAVEGKREAERLKSELIEERDLAEVASQKIDRLRTLLRECRERLDGKRRAVVGLRRARDEAWAKLAAAEEQARSARARVEELEKALHEAKALSNLGYNIRHAEGCENETDESDVTASEYQQEHDALLRRIDAVIIRPDSRPEAHTPEPKR